MSLRNSILHTLLHDLSVVGCDFDAPYFLNLCVVAFDYKKTHKCAGDGINKFTFDHLTDANEANSRSNHVSKMGIHCASTLLTGLSTLTQHSTLA